MWYALFQDEQIGPLSVESAADLVHNGTADGHTLVWADGMADWQPMMRVRDFAMLFMPDGSPLMYEEADPDEDGDEAATLMVDPELGENWASYLDQLAAQQAARSAPPQRAPQRAPQPAPQPAPPSLFPPRGGRGSSGGSPSPSLAGPMAAIPELSVPPSLSAPPELDLSGPAMPGLEEAVLPLGERGLPPRTSPLKWVALITVLAVLGAGVGLAVRYVRRSATAAQTSPPPDRPSDPIEARGQDPSPNLAPPVVDAAPPAPPVDAAPPAPAPDAAPPDAAPPDAAPDAAKQVAAAPPRPKPPTPKPPTPKPPTPKPPEPAAKVLSRDDLMKVIQANTATLRACASDDPELKGHVSVFTTINRDGSVSAAQVVTAKFRKSAAKPCVEKTVRAFRFPAFAGEPMRLNLPLNL